MLNLFASGFFDAEALMMIGRRAQPMQKLVMKIFSEICGAWRRLRR